MLDKLKSKASTEFWVISVLFILGLLVRLYHLGVPSFCDDEISTTRRINHSLIETMLLLRYTAFPPLHYAILNLWVRIFGSGEWALRFPSAIFSSLTVIVIYKLGKELFSKSVGLISALLLVFSPFAINYAQNAKMYALYWFLTSVSFLFFFYFLKDQKKSSYRSYIFASILCCYTMYTGFLFLAIQSTIFLLMGERRRWRQWFKGQLIIVSLCVPWVIYFLCSQHEVFCLRPSDAVFNYCTFFLNSFLRILGNYEGGFRGLELFLYVFLIIYFLVDALATLRNYYLLIWLMAPVFIYFMFDYFFIRAQLVERYIGFLQVPLILLVSSQVNSFRGLIKKILVVTIVVMAMGNTYLYFRDNLRIPEQDWRKTAGELTQDLGKDDIVLSFVGLPMFEYYYKADMHRFFEISEKDCSSESLMKKGILKENVHSIFILYEEEYAPQIKLNGFFLDYKVSFGASGFLHFQRIQSKINVGQ